MESQHVVLQNPGGQYKAVKLGFSWITLLRIWVLVGIILFIIDANHGSRRPEWLVIFLLQDVIGIPLGVVIARRWNEWFRQRLYKQGYQQVDVITASNPEGAVALHIKQTRS